MPGFYASLVVGIFFGISAASAQTPKSSTMAPNNTRRHDFLKNLTVQSFGYSATPTGPGFEFPEKFSSGSSTAYGLQCPYCLIWPNRARSRYTLPAFGSRATLKPWRDRTELFTEFGGLNAWKPDNSLIDLRRPHGTSFNDAWLLQGVAGARVAVDPGRHLWLGTAARYFSNFGEGRQHWNSLSGSATFNFGH